MNKVKKIIIIKIKLLRLETFVWGTTNIHGSIYVEGISVYGADL